MALADKPFDQMTLDELRAELAQWDDRIARGVFSSGTALKLALTCRNLCARWMARRETEVVGVAA